MKRPRLDQLVMQRGLAESREKAQRLILAGKIRIAGQVATKPGHSVDADAELELEAPERFVSRGGEKLEAALAHWDVPVSGAICLDVGASTGGFTDCLLQRGATRVYAVDVGRHQLHERLRTDPRVVSMEGVNARTLEPSSFPEAPTIAVADASFISLSLLFPAIRRVLAGHGTMITLIKPQFEAGRAEVKRGGVIRDPAVHQRVVAQIRAEGEQCGFLWQGVIESPLRGPAGNVEFLAFWKAP